MSFEYFGSLRGLFTSRFLRALERLTVVRAGSPSEPVYHRDASLRLKDAVAERLSGHALPSGKGEHHHRRQCEPDNPENRPLRLCADREDVIRSPLRGSFRSTGRGESAP
jgi:hypothetical protein